MEKIIILTLILCAINFFTKDSISKALKSNLSKYINLDISDELNTYLKSFITNVNINLNKNNKNKIQANSDFVNKLLLSLKIINSNKFQFINPKINQSIFYYEYPNGKLIKPFILNTMINNTIINIEIVSFLYNNNNIAILDIKLVNVKVKPQYKFKSTNKNKDKEIINEDIFIKPTITYDDKEKNDTDASLIPSVIEFSNDYETDSASSRN
jgi:hypothetical protein